MEPTLAEAAVAARKDPVDWDIFPLAAVTVDHIPVQALFSRKGLVKGNTYYIVNIHETGSVYVLGGTEAVPMHYFRGARHKTGPVGGGTLATTSPERREPIAPGNEGTGAKATGVSKKGI